MAVRNNHWSCCIFDDLSVLQFLNGNMMKFAKVIFSVLLVVCIVSVANSCFAQCSMCQATIASNLEAGGKTGGGLNNGIMYLLAAPYVLVLGVGALWYKKYRKKSIPMEMKSDKINLN